MLSSEMLQAEALNVPIVERGMDDIQDAIEDRLVELAKRGLSRGSIAAWFLRSKAHAFYRLDLELNSTDEHDWSHGLATYAAHYSEQ
jgi:hypothetical protein